MRPRLGSLGLGSFRSQIIVLTACVTAFAMALLTLVLQLLLADLTRRNVDALLEDRADAVASSAVATSTGDRLVVPDADLDAGVVVYDDQGRQVTGTATRGLQREYDALGTTDRREYRDIDDEIRLIAEPFATDSGSRGVVVVSERLAPYEQAERYALIVSLVTGLLATGAAAAIAAWVTTRALRPVGVLATTAAEWSEHDLARRFDLGPPTNEITSLAATLDTLLDKVSMAISSEQRLTSELAHELRTPLTAVQGTADLVLMREELPVSAREDLEEISVAARRMAATIETLLELARSDVTLLAAASCSLVEVVDEVVCSLSAGRGSFAVDIDDDRVGAPRDLVLRAVAPVVENAARFARATVTVTSSTADGHGVRLLIADDGPGIPEGLDDIFEPGTTSGSGAGLGLAIARRVARSVGGELELTSRNPTVFTVRLPSA
ncbi:MULTISPECIES: sensor histidine kinase [Nocardioides]|uniref:histidine kinase n=1 Tax=Nocardioides vastitatis TaxID=2568655 RepID=A0ABW0ZC33_9ACTN|nr:HAMP domain-containing sensor histidine kinase [Nocardioides sp.]THJ05344.1 HAMP domain-containing histidine kinase [Nocardioides sp.]